MIDEATLTFATAKPQLPPRWRSLYHPFSGQVWAAVVGLLFLLPPTLLLVARLEVTITPEEGEGRSPPGPLLVTQDVVGTLLGQDLTRRLPSRSSTQIVVGAWLVLAFIVGTAYRGNLTAFLTVLKYPARPENLEQLLKTDARVVMPTYFRTLFYDSFKKSNSTLNKMLVDRTYFVASHDEGLQHAMEKNEAYVYEGLKLQLLVAENYTRDDGWSPLYVARRPIQPGYAVWYAPRDAPYIYNFDRCILAFHGAGLIQRWSQLVLDDASIRERAKRKERASSEGKMASDEVAEKMLSLVANSEVGLQALTLTHLQGPFFLLVLGLTVALHVLVGEVLMAYYTP
nr:ionotropic receptor 93a-like [Procambarus clarkii]